jgi:acetolactate synthase regulatory subunit
MTDKIHKMFDETLKQVLRTKRQIGFRLCADEKDELSPAELVPIGTIVTLPNCPPGTKNVLDLIVSIREIQKEKEEYEKQKQEWEERFR